MGVFFAIAQKNEDKEKARKMIRNYVIGLVVIFAILVACPYLVKGIAADCGVRRQGFTKNSISGREIGLTTHSTCDIIIVQIKRILHA